MAGKSLLICCCLFWIYSLGHAQPVNTNISDDLIFDGEPYLAVNPTNPQNMVAAWMAEQYTKGEFVITMKTRASFDGGNTWSAYNTLPHNGTGFGSADVSMAFDKGGLLYICYIDWRQIPNDSGGIYVARSIDGGLTWDTPSMAFNLTDVPGKYPIDRPWMVVDRSSGPYSGTLYITSKPAYFIPPPNRNYYKLSTDSGHTWSAIAPVDGGNYLVGNNIAQPMAAPVTTVNGNFCAVYPSYLASQNILPSYYLATSNNGGQSFSYTTVISTPAYPVDTNLKSGYRLIASGTDSNKMAVVAVDAPDGDADIVALHSNDGGQTWSSPLVRVNDDSIGNGKDQDMVWGAYNAEGNLVVTWRDRRNSPVQGFWNAGYDFYYAISTDNGQTFSPNQKLTSQFVSFDSILTAKGNDFMTCYYKEDTLYTLWGDNRTGKMNIFFTKTIASSDTTLGIVLLDGDGPGWNMFPNPTVGNANVSVSEEMLGQKMYIYDEQGRTVSTVPVTGLSFTLPMQNLPAGVYYIRLGNVAQRMVKQ